MVMEMVQSLPFFRVFAQKISEDEKKHEEKLRLLKEGIDESKNRLRAAHENFNNVTEPKLIDFYIYKIQAEQSRYEQLLLEYRNEEREFIHYSAK